MMEQTARILSTEADAWSNAWINDDAIAKGSVMVHGRPVKLPSTELAWLYNHDAEREVLGAMLLAGELGSSRALFEKLYLLDYRHFHSTVHGNLWRCIERLYKDGKSPDLISVTHMARGIGMRGQTLLEQIGGEAGLQALLTIRGGDVESTARLIIELAIKRHGVTVIHRLVGTQRAADISIEAYGESFLSGAEEIARRIAQLRTPNIGSVRNDIGAEVAALLKQAEIEPGIPTGFAGLDQALYGWLPARLYTFAAPPGWGKSALLMSAALQALLRGKRVLFVTLELGKSEILQRFMAMLTGIDSSRIQTRSFTSLTPEQMTRLQSLGSVMSQLASDMSIVELLNPTPTQLKGAIDDAFARADGYDLVAIDYVGELVMRTEQAQSRPDPTQLITDIYSKLVAIKTHYRVPVLTAMQMNSDYGSRRDKRPQLTDLRYGVPAAAASDVVGFIYLEAKAKPDKSDDDNSGKAEIVVRKNRYGPQLGTIELVFAGEYNRFTDLYDSMWKFEIRDGRAYFPGETRRPGAPLMPRPNLDNL